MNPETSSSTSNPNAILPHCRQRTPSGRRCRMAVSEPDSGLCSKHAAEHQRDLDQADLAPTLIGSVQEFRSAADINHSLGELYKLQARNKITPRRAAVMAYTASLLLRTLPAISEQEEAAKDAEPIEARFGPWFQEMIAYKRRIADEHWRRVNGDMNAKPERQLSDATATLSQSAPNSVSPEGKAK